MTLIKTIQADYLASRYAKDTLKSNLLSTLLGEAQAIGKDAGNRDATDTETVAVIKKFIKNCGATHVEAVKSNNQKMIEQSANEVLILNAYLPKQFEQAKLTFLVQIFLEENPDANMGHVMGYFKTNYAGRYDGKLLSEITKEQLA